MRHSLFLASLVAGVSGVIAAQPAPQKAMLHPQAALIIRDKAPLVEFRLEGAAGAPAAWPFQGSPKRATVGGASASIDASFGDIRRVALDSAGNAYVIDAQLNDVAIIGADGAIRTRLGLAHDRSSPVRRPISVFPYGKRVYIGELNRRVHIYEWAGDSLQFVKTATVDVSPNDMCVIGGQLILQGATMERSEVLHTYTLAGVSRESFGRVYETPNQIVRYSFAKGRIACDESTGIIVFASSGGIPDVRGYDASGALRWVAPIADFRPTEIMSEADGSMSMRMPPTFHRITTVQPLSRGKALVQVQLVSPRTTQNPEKILREYSIQLDTKTGKTLPLPSTVPAVAAISRAGFAVLPAAPAQSVELWGTAGRGK